MPILTTLGAACARAWGFTSGLLKDPYFNLTTLLLPGNGTNGAQNNTFLDSSTNNFTITRNGNTTQGTFSPFSQTGWGNYFNGTNASLSVATNTAFDFSTGDFTVECWIYMTQYNAGNYEPIFNNAYLFYISSSGAVLLFNGTSDVITGSSGDVPLNSWNHVAYVRNGSGTNNTKVYVNGVQKAQGTVTAAIGSASPNLIGQYSTTYFPGYISNLRITKGRAVYTGAFTPPATPLTRTTGGTNPPQGTECSLLTCQSNRFLDSNGVNTPASSPLTITANGSPSVVAFSPFAPTAAYTTAAVGGSGYFDGTGDYLSVANNAALSYGTGAFTIEGFFYTSATSQYGSIFSDENLLGTTGLTLLMNPTVGNGQLVLYGNGTLLVTATGKYNDNAWHHFAISRDSTNLRLYVDGVYIGASASGSTNFDASQPLLLMSSTIAGRTISGYLSSFRTIKGTALYTGTSSITVPTAPLTAVSGTSLLLNFTNAGITDATAKNDLETVGNAQISTAISAKWGSGSMYFDGTGDYLNTLSTWAISGSEAYTLEAWIYPTTVSGDLCIYETRSSSGTGFVLFINSTGKLQVYDSTGLLQTASTTTLTANTWTYIAMVRSAGSSTNTFYVNGTSAGTFTLASFAAATSARIGARNDGVAAYNGYMQDFRITKGYARTITASPTAPFPRQ